MDFYSRLEGAEDFFILFPTNDINLPDWDEHGNLIEYDESEWRSESIKAVPLGNDFYRLAEKDPLFSEFKLQLGEDFIALRNNSCNKDLILQHIILPERYVHEVKHVIMDVVSWRNSEEARLISEYFGGWEYCMCVLTISIPLENYPLFDEKRATIN